LSEDGNNQVDVVSTRSGVNCYVYGEKEGTGNTLEPVGKLDEL
jgi:hypothetical protein